MGRPRTQPSKWFSPPQPKTLKKLQPRPGTIPYQDLIAIRKHRRCGKCQGLVLVARQDLDPFPELRCINCGWRPQHNHRVTTESDANRLMRQAARTLVHNDVVIRQQGGPGNRRTEALH